LFRGGKGEGVCQYRCFFQTAEIDIYGRNQGVAVDNLPLSMISYDVKMK